MKTMFLVFICAICAPAAWAQVNQSTALGQIELAELDRGNVDPANNVLEQHIANYKNSNGGPMLAKIGVQLGNIIRNTYAGLLMTVIMTLMVGAAWLRAMRDQAALGELGASLAIKFIIGIAVFHLPSLVYGVGMTVRDLGAIIAKMAFTSPVTGPTLSQMSITGAPESLSFERIRAMSIDRAIQDLGQPMNGVGANVAYLLYDQLVARAVSLAGQAGQPPLPRPISSCKLPTSWALPLKRVASLTKTFHGSCSFSTVRISLPHLPIRPIAWGRTACRIRRPAPMEGVSTMESQME